MWGDNGREGEIIHREGGRTIQQREARRGTMGDKGRQDPREGRHTIQQRATRRGTMGDKERQRETRPIHHPTKGNKKRTSNSTLFVEQEGVQSETKGDKTLQKTPSNKGKQETRPSGRRPHHPTNGNKNEHNGGQWETGAKTLGKANTPSNKGKQEAVQWETRGDKTLGKADTPSNKGKEERVQWETRASGRRTQHPTKAKKKGYNGRQDPREGGHNIQQRQRKRGTMGDKTLGKADTPSNKGQQEGVQWTPRGDKTLGKADTPSNKGKEEAVQWETRPSGRRTRHPTKAKKGCNERQGPRPSGRRTRHPTKGIKKGYNGRQGETRPSGRRTHHPTKAKRKGYNGRQDPREGGHTIQQRQKGRGTMGDKTLGKADTPSNKGKEEGVQWETRPS